MPDALAFENPSTSCSFLLAAEFHRPPKTFCFAANRPGKSPAYTRDWLFRVQLDDQLLVECRRLHVFALGHGHHLGLQLVAINLQPRHSVLALRHVARFHHHDVLAHIVLDRQFIAGLYQVRRDIHFLPVDAHVPVQNKLPSLRVRPGEARAPDNVVQAPLQRDDQVFAGRPLDAQRLLEIAAELPLQQPVGALHLLLFAQLQTVTRYFRATRLSVLSRNEVALLNGTLLRETPQTFQKQLLPFPAAQAANRFSMSCQLLVLPSSNP